MYFSTHSLVILDFGFWILDWTRFAIQNPKFEIQNSLRRLLLQNHRDVRALAQQWAEAAARGEAPPLSDRTTVDVDLADDQASRV
jgi:hypothetical protein